MLSTDDLFALALEIGRSPSCAERLVASLTACYRAPEYQAWLDMDQYSGACFRLPPHLGNDVLQDLRLVDDAQLKIKINKRGDRILITDGVWVDGKIRVFPFTDESELLYTYAESQGLIGWADIMIDPATGSGSHPVAAPREVKKFAFDINPRALLYSSINRALNGIPNFLIGQNNISDNLPPEVSESAEGNVLFLANMPFSPSSADMVLPISTNGGHTGADLTFALFEAINDFARVNSRRTGGRALALCYSVGNSTTGKWQVVERAKTIFGERARWLLLEDEKLWRVNGRREQPNPMYLATSLPLRDDCKFYTQSSAQHRDPPCRDYANLAASLNQAGWDVLGYGIVDIEF